MSEKNEINVNEWRQVGETIFQLWAVDMPLLCKSIFGNINFKKEYNALYHVSFCSSLITLYTLSSVLKYLEAMCTKNVVSLDVTY